MKISCFPLLVVGIARTQESYLHIVSRVGQEYPCSAVVRIETSL